MNDYLAEVNRAICLAANIYNDLVREREGKLSSVVASNASFFGTTPITEDFAYNFLQYTQDKLSIDVKVKRFKRSENGGLEAYILRFDNDGKKSATIGVADGNPCHVRFFTCKELMHIHLATDENATATSQDFARLLEELTSRPSSGAQGHSKQTMVDNAAWFGAIELLMPSHLLECLMGPPLEMDDPERIAEIFRMPRYIVEQAVGVELRELFGQARASGSSCNAATG